MRTVVPALILVPALASAPLDSAAPVIHSLSQNMVVAGTTILRLQVNGAQFDSVSQVLWNGRPLQTTYYRSTLLGAVVPGTSLAVPGTATVSVVDPRGDSTSSNAVTFTIGNRVPEIAYKYPSAAPLMGEAFAMRVHGRYFVPGALIRWNGSAMPTVYVDSTHLTTTVPASLLAAAGTPAVTVFNPPPMGGQSAASPMTVEFMTPTMQSNLPAATQWVDGSSDVTLPFRVTGRAFLRSAVVRLDGLDLPTTWISEQEVGSVIPSSVLHRVGYSSVTVRVTIPGLGSRESAPRQFAVSSPKPLVTGARPGVLLRRQTTRVTLAGVNFMPQIVASRNGSARRVAFVDPTQIQVMLDSTDVAETGSITLRLANPSPTIHEGSTTLAVVNPVPVATSLSPANVYVGGAAFTLSVSGSGFVPETIVRVNGSPRLTQFVSRNQLRAGIPASDLTQGGSLTITATSPSPGGGASDPLKLNRLFQSTRTP